MMRNKKLILFDLDDTLLNSSKEISPHNAKAIVNCKAAGHIMGYITARSLRKVKAFLGDLPCDCIAYYNGATLYAGDVLFRKNLIPYKIGMEVMRKIRSAYPRVRIGAYLEPYSFFDGELREITTGKASRVELMDLPGCDFQRIRIVFDPTEGFDPDGFLTDELRGYVSVHGSAVIVHQNARKENALRTFADHFGVPLSDVVAFGDDINDIGMISAAGVGVAMGNAAQPVKEAADAIADTNDNDGVAKWLNQNLL